MHLTIKNWYLFAPKIGTLQDPSDPTQYSYLKEENILSTSIGKSSKVRAIKATDNEGLPVIDQDLLYELFFALQNKKDSENVLLNHDNFK